MGGIAWRTTRGRLCRHQVPYHLGHLARRSDSHFPVQERPVFLIALDGTGNVSLGYVHLYRDAIGRLPERVDRDGRQRGLESGEILVRTLKLLRQTLQRIHPGLIPALPLQKQPLLGPARQQFPAQITDEMVRVGKQRAPPGDDLTGGILHQVQIDPYRRGQSQTPQDHPGPSRKHQKTVPARTADTEG